MIPVLGLMGLFSADSKSDTIRACQRSVLVIAVTKPLTTVPRPTIVMHDRDTHFGWPMCSGEPPDRTVGQPCQRVTPIENTRHGWRSELVMEVISLSSRESRSRRWSSICVC